jgi:hypothetical protein
MRRILVLFTINLFVAACTHKATTPLTYPKAQLEFANGGGFTGMVNSIYLMDNGDVYRGGMNDTTFVKIGTIDINKATQYFDTYQKLGLHKIELNEPGNRYYYITYKNGNDTHKIQWGGSELANKNPSILYAVVMDLVKKLNSETTKEK